MPLPFPLRASRATCLLPLAVATAAFFLPRAIGAPTLVRQPRPISTTVGQSATFSVAAVTNGEPPRFQWRRNGVALVGATNDSYTIPVARQGHSDNYDVTVSADGTTVTSDIVYLQVAPPAFPTGIAPDLVSSLRLEGKSVAFLDEVVVLPDGRYYAIGPFSSAQGVPNPGIVRFDADGRLDRTFAPPLFDRMPRTIAVQADGKIVLGGGFRMVGGVPTGSIVRLNPDGSRDSSFAVGAGFSSPVDWVGVTRSGIVYVRGTNLASYQGVGPLGWMARLRPDATIDRAFVPPTLLNDRFVTNSLRQIISPEGDVYYLGSFDQVNGVPRQSLVRMRADGTLDPDFVPRFPPRTWLTSGVLEADGRLVLAGEFTSYDGSPAGRIVRLNRDGSAVSSFVLGSGFSAIPTVLLALPGGKTLVNPGGNYRGSPVGPTIRLNPDASVDPTFIFPFRYSLLDAGLTSDGRIVASGYYMDDNDPASVRLMQPDGALAPLDKPDFRFPAHARIIEHLHDGGILLAGDFTHIDGKPAAYVAKLKPDLTRDPDYPRNGQLYYPVTAAVVQADGSAVLFQEVGADRIAADGTFDRDYLGTAPIGDTLSSPIALAGGQILVATIASQWGNGTPVSRGLVLLDRDGRRITPVNHPILSGVPAGARISHIRQLPGGKILIAGQFSTWAGANRPRLVRLHPNGTLDESFTLDPTLVNTSFGLAPVGPVAQSDGRIVIALNSNPYSMLRLLPDGARDSTFTTPLPRPFEAVRFSLQADDRILVSYRGQSIAANPYFDTPVFFRRLEKNGTVDYSLDVQATGYLRSFLVTDAGHLLGSDDRGLLYRFRTLTTPVISVPPAGRSAPAGSPTTFQVSVSGPPPFTYQWFKDDVALVGATSATLTLDYVQFASTGRYTVSISNAAGSVTSAGAFLNVTNRPLPGFYQGALGTSGYFALYVRPDSRGTLLGYDRARRVSYVARDFPVDESRRFTFQAETTGPDGSISIEAGSGMISNEGSVTVTFSDAASVWEGVAVSAVTPSPFAGWHVGGALGTSATCFAIVGPTGNVIAVQTRAIGTDAARGTVDGAGRVALGTESGGRLEGAFQASAAPFELTLSRTGATPVRFSGLNETRRTAPDRLVNLSVRSEITRTASTLSAGFYVNGQQPQTVLVRAVGPGLAGFGLSDALPAARIEVVRGSTPVAAGADWETSVNPGAVAATASRVGAFSLSAGSRDAALLAVLGPGAYSANVTGQDGATGTVLVEIYDTTAAPDLLSTRLSNLSTLGPAGSSERPLAVGFYVAGQAPRRVLIRGAGPTLAQFGVASPLPQPRLSVMSATGSVAENSAWGTSAEAKVIAHASGQVGAFPFAPGSDDSALVLWLAPGAYTARVIDNRATPGTALLEVYELP